MQRHDFELSVTPYPAPKVCSDAMVLLPDGSHAPSAVGYGEMAVRVGPFEEPKLVAIIGEPLSKEVAIRYSSAFAADVARNNGFKGVDLDIVGEPKTLPLSN